MLTSVISDVAYVLICFYPWVYILNVKSPTRKLLNMFSIAVHIFRNLFCKVCPLFGQILIKCLECSRASFSLYSYSKKMRWGRENTFLGDVRENLSLFCTLISISRYTSSISVLHCPATIHSWNT